VLSARVAKFEFKERVLTEIDGSRCDRATLQVSVPAFWTAIQPPIPTFWKHRFTMKRGWLFVTIIDSKHKSWRCGTGRLFAIQFYGTFESESFIKIKSSEPGQEFISHRKLLSAVSSRKDLGERRLPGVVLSQLSQPCDCDSHSRLIRVLEPSRFRRLWRRKKPLSLSVY
jgi:hypothetical protein